MKLNEYKTGETLEPPATFVGKAAQAYGPNGAVHAGTVVAARYSDDGSELFADVALISYAEPREGRLVAEARLIVQGGLALGSDTNPKPHTFSIIR